MVVHRSRLVLDQVLKDQLTPPISARLHKHSTFREPAKFDRRETEIFRKRTNLRCGAVIVARQEHDSPAPMYGRNHAGDERAFIGGEERDGSRDFLWLAPATHWDL